MDVLACKRIFLGRALNTAFLHARASCSLDTQAEEIQANAAEALVNATRNHGEEVTARIHSLGISPLVLMCGSENLQVTRDWSTCGDRCPR